MTGDGVHFMLLGRLDAQELPFVRAWENPNPSEIIGVATGAMVVP